MAQRYYLRLSFGTWRNYRESTSGGRLLGPNTCSIWNPINLTFHLVLHSIYFYPSLSIYCSITFSLPSMLAFSEMHHRHLLPFILLVKIIAFCPEFTYCCYAVLWPNAQSEHLFNFAKLVRSSLQKKYLFSPLLSWTKIYCANVQC